MLWLMTMGRRLNGVYAAFMLVAFMMGVAGALQAPTLSLFLSREVGAQPFWVGLFYTVNAIAGILVSLALAKRSDSKGDRRKLIMFCCLMAIGNALLFAFNRHYLTLITCGVLFASLANTAMPQLFALAREYADNSAREVVMFSSVMRAQLSLAWVIGPPLAFMLALNYGFTAMFSIAQICSGMAKIQLLPSVFMRKNKRGTPYVGLLLVAAAMILINITGLSTSDQLTFLILTGCTFWIFSYIILHFDVLILRKRLPKAPRTFKLPFGPLIPIIGIIGNGFMIYNIDSSWEVKKRIYLIFVITVAILSVYAVIWIKCVMKRPMFKAYQIKEVMAMESDLYQINHNPDVAKKLHLDAKPEIESMPADVNTGTRPE